MSEFQRRNKQKYQLKLANCRIIEAPKSVQIDTQPGRIDAEKNRPTEFNT